MKEVFCSKCNKRLKVTPTALKEFGKIINKIDPHECGEYEPYPFEKVTPITYQVEPEHGDKIVQNPDDLPIHRGFPLPEGSGDLRDRRFDEKPKTTTAPDSVQRMIDEMSTSTPARDVPLTDPDSDPESEE